MIEEWFWLVAYIVGIYIGFNIRQWSFNIHLKFTRKPKSHHELLKHQWPRVKAQWEKTYGPIKK